MTNIFDIKMVWADTGSVSVRYPCWLNRRDLNVLIIVMMIITPINKNDKINKETMKMPMKSGTVLKGIKVTIPQNKDVNRPIKDAIKGSL